ncbi:MAG: hypothetical protein RLZZ470_1636 [Pseudomonadota bacterium]|jgi:hypothetical protein
MMTAAHSHKQGRRGAWRWASLLLACLAMSSANATTGATALLRCHIEVNGEVHTHEFLPRHDPYTAPSIQIGERFRFKAVVLGEGDRVDLVNIYAYYQTRRQPMLMQHSKYVNPTAMTQPAPDALTGRVALYSPVLGKELAYQCALIRGTP